MRQQNISRGVTILRLNSAQICSENVGLKDRFEDELNPMLERMIPDDDWNGRLVFKGAFDKSLHRIREHIITATGRDPQRLHGEKQMNPKLEMGEEQSAETILNLPRLRGDLKKLKN
jgi:hypothetical protein